MMRICALAFAIGCGAASAEPLSACDFITQAEVEAMVDEPVAPPIVYDGGICAGVCDSINESSCVFDRPGKGDDAFHLQVLLPPFDLGDAAGVVREIFNSQRRNWESMKEVPGFDGTALWSYATYERRSVLYVFRGNTVHLVVQQSGVAPEAALANAVRTARRALERFAALKPRELKNAFQFGYPGREHPWQPGK